MNTLARNCLILALAAVYALPGRLALAYPALSDDPEKLARVHCQLLRHAAGDTRPVTTALLNEMAGAPGFSGRAGIATTDDLQLLTHGQPDMGFVVGDRWMFATRDDQKMFNTLFTQMVVKRFRLAAPAAGASYKDSCVMGVHISEKRKKSDPELPPEKRTYVAMARGLVQGPAKEPLVLIYNMQKKPGQAWRILDLFIDNVGLAYTYQPHFNQVIAHGGFSAVAQELRSPPAGK